MGYTTDFYGSVDIDPPLNAAEISYLKQFAETRRMDRDKGPYFVGGSGEFGQGHDPDIRDHNASADGQPGLWCQWVPTDDGASLEWDQGEKFYNASEWMGYLIDHFLKPGAWAALDLDAAIRQDARFAAFTFDHTCNGEIEAKGEDADDLWLIDVSGNDVTVKDGKVVYS
jgi:hypothetical protein